MTEVPFHATRMGARFYEHTVPELARAVERLASALERIADLHGAGRTTPKTENEDDPQGRDQEP